MIDPKSVVRGMQKEIAPGVWYLPVLMANVYLVGERGGPWVLIDAGVPGGSHLIKAAADLVFGCPPEAILLTHGHFDHVGALPSLADDWNVSIYAHRRETPFLMGRSDYPQPDPTVGGFMAQGMSRFFPHKAYDFGERLRLLPEDNSIPYMSDWRWVFTPGHTSGHVSFFRESDRVLIAGDAFITVNQENPLKLFSQVRELRNPPAYLTQDWDQAHESVVKLAGLEPLIAAAGHGLPLTGDGLAVDLHRFAAAFRRPSKGRYVTTSVGTDETGAIVSTPPSPSDRFPLYAAGFVAAAAAGMLLSHSRKQHRVRQSSQS